MYAIKIKALDKLRYMRESYYMYRVLTDLLMKSNINNSQRGQVGAAEEALQVEGIVQIFLSCNSMIVNSEIWQNILWEKTNCFSIYDNLQDLLRKVQTALVEDEGVAPQQEEEKLGGKEKEE